MRIVQLNLAADPALHDPELLLESYRTLTGWSDALVSAGAAVHVVQRFSRTTTVQRRGVNYQFVADGQPGVPLPWTVFPQIASAVDQVSPDVIHINGLMFPGMLRRLRRQSGQRTVIVLQDHSGALPGGARWPFNIGRSFRWQRAFRDADACTFTSCDLARRWRLFGMRDEMRVLEISEASTTLEPMSRHDGRQLTGLSGIPAVLWVGRLDQNKDPLTILAGLERALPTLPDAHVWMIASTGVLREDVQKRIELSPGLRGRVTMVGPIAHRDMAAYYSSADIFISASHHEGSGYALIEAMACGVVPCVTDIPAFRALTGGCGALWPVGNDAAFAAALRELATRNLHTERDVVRRRFDDALSWPVIGRQTADAYAQLIEARQAAQ